MLFEGSHDTEKSRELIRDLFEELEGRVSLRVLALEMRKRHIFPDFKDEALLLRAYMEEARLALKRKELDGTPYAKPTGDEDHIWKQLKLFDYEEMEGLIERTSLQIEADYKDLLKLRQFYKEKFGRAPTIPKLVAAAMSLPEENGPQELRPNDSCEQS